MKYCKNRGCKHLITPCKSHCRCTGKLDSDVDGLVEALELAQRQFSDIREEWWGAEHFKAKLCSEAYLQQIGESMVKEATIGYAQAQQALDKYREESND